MVPTAQSIKETGATFTPPLLADYLSEKLLAYLGDEVQKIKVLDPACGEGSLLSSISKKLLYKNINFELTGFDSNKTYLEIASKNLTDLSSDSLVLHTADFLEAITPKNQQVSLFDPPSSKAFINNTQDLIIANPPYVRTQILGADKAQLLAKKFNLKGRVDLYYPFLIAMTYALKENGLLGVITSNRYLFTKSGNSVRNFLFNNYDILEVIDLGDTKLFDAAVLPAIFIGRKRKNIENTTAKFLKIYEELNGYKGNLIKKNNVFEVLDSPKSGFFTDGTKRYKKSKGIIKFGNTKEKNWTMLSDKEAKWVQKIEKNSVEVVGNSFKVRVGIKTTADKVFISDSWGDLRENAPETTLLKSLLSQENLKSWGICNKKKLSVLYPHFSKDGVKKVIDLEEYPKAKQYFQSNKETLQKRKYVIEAGRNWFEIWVPQNPSLWKFPKLVFPDISATPRFYLDESGKIVNGNCYWIVATQPEEIDKLRLIQGVANTKLMTKYHDLVFSNKLYAGRRRYFSQYIQNYPLPDVLSIKGQAIIKTVKKITISVNKEEIPELTRLLEIQVATAFGVEPVFNVLLK